MISKIFPVPLSFIILINFFACAGLPVLEKSNTGKNADNLLLKGKFRITQSIKAELPDGNNALLIGITIADTDTNTISAVLMTVEGIVLLDAEYKDNRVSVNRSVPPFDSAEFSTGLIDDIRLIYLVSCRDAVESGTSDGIFIERYKCRDGNIIDISANDGSVDIRKYNSGKKLSRRAHLSKINKEGVPGQIEIIAPGFLGYSLSLDLLSSEKIK